MRIAYFNCFAGISGDMALGALLDCGADVDELREQLGSLGVDGWSLETSRTTKRGIAATNVEVVCAETHAHRGLSDILKIIDKSALAPRAKSRAEQIFRHVAKAEGEVHGKSPDEIHFHEVGAVDSIVDICGVAIALEILGVDKVCGSEVHLGSGTVECAHGTLPVPAPATMKLLEGIPVYSTGIKSELVTPTGAAILAGLGEDFGGLPPMVPEKSGFGAGKRDLNEIANVLRVIIGVSSNVHEEDTVIVVETNIDDMNPECVASAVEKIMDAGALDVFVQQGIMKKGRPGFLMSVICAPGHEDAIADVLFRETSTFGIRRYHAQRTVLDRETRAVSTRFGEIAVKLGRRRGHLVSLSPEFEDCRRLAEKCGIAVREVYSAAAAEAAKLMEE